MLTQDKHSGQTYNLNGEALTQKQLAEYLNRAFDTSLSYTAMTVDEYREDRVAELGEFIGTVIAGIYQGIKEGKADNPSHYAMATGRVHMRWDAYFEGLRSMQARV